MADDETRAWLVERTYPDDEQNLVIAVYATTDGERYLRKERALTSFTGPARDTYAATDAPAENFWRCHRLRRTRALRRGSPPDGHATRPDRHRVIRTKGVGPFSGFRCRTTSENETPFGRIDTSYCAPLAVRGTHDSGEGPAAASTA